MTIDFRSNRTMTRSLSALSAVVLSVGVIGCNNNEYDNDPAAVNDQQIESAITAAALDGVPQDIKGRIIEDLEGMRITSVNTQNSPEGILYRVNFVDATGQAGQRVYDRSGTQRQLPSETGQPSENVEGSLTPPPPAPSGQQSGQQMNQQPGQQPRQQPGQQSGQQTTIPPTNTPATQPAAEPAGTPQGRAQ